MIAFEDGHSTVMTGWRLWSDGIVRNEQKGQKGSVGAFMGMMRAHAAKVGEGKIDEGKTKEWFQRVMREFKASQEQ